MTSVTIEHPPEHEQSTGARPAGVTTEQAAATSVQQMFDIIAPTYDRANHLLSAGIDRYWWTRTARLFRPILQHPEAVILDLCCGTGDMTLALYQHRPKQTQDRVPHLRDGLIVAKVGEAPQRSAADTHLASSQRVGDEDSASTRIAPILAVDFSHQMLSLGAKKFAPHNILPIEADALHLPIANNSVDLVTSAFGFRNLANYEEGLAELHRILRPGGQLGILEANQPEGLTGSLYNLYFKTVLPKLGGLISGQRAAYTYLPTSVERFPRPPRMLQLLRDAGFTNPTWTSYTFGTAGLYHATRP
ncbi:class I SAM-dependent methyltransferase [Granulicella sp. L60]|uniref:class I SAM-dependent methyltransferase n=1 Tax=Granulicella sp. L60 TaxID=1641866 RepID=UPI00131B706B|nr:class I SAM-dependent methyltransferase [Granulicella sp. L60]